jgi:hypothetical protein
LVAALDPLPTEGIKTIGYLGYNYDSRIKLNQLTGGIWEVLRPTSPSNLTLVCADGGSINRADAMIAALHAVGRPCEFSVFSQWGDPNYATYNQIFTNTAYRQQLFDEIVRIFTLKPGFDRVNMDWESDNRGVAAQDITNFYAALYAILQPMGKTISATENYGKVVMTTAAAQYLKFIGLMTYDVGAMPIWYGTLAEMQTDLNRWANAGFDRKKLLAGITFGARKWPNPPSNNWFSYASVVDQYNPPDSANQAGDYYYNGPDLVGQKAQWVKDNGFGGVFTYGTQLDKMNDPRSLLQHIYEVML